MPEIPSPEPAAEPARVARGRERVFRWPLVVFLLGIAGVAAFGTYERFRTPSVDEAVRWLADGDLDAKERHRPLVALVAAARASDSGEVRLAGLMASISIGDKAAYGDLCAALGGGPAPSKLPSPQAMELLHLGDPMLDNCLRAFVAEASGDRAAAAQRWLQVRAQAGFADHPFGRELAEAGLLRNR